MEEAPDFTNESTVDESAAGSDAVVPEEMPVPAEPVPPITSRFLFVDVAALRAKQLRRGARLRYDLEPGTPAPKKPERMAMEEVKRCLVHYAVPRWRDGRVDTVEQ
jgi:DNA-directed RNA polymerase subunit K/omega